MLIENYEQPIYIKNVNLNICLKVVIYYVYKDNRDNDTFIKVDVNIIPHIKIYS